MFLVLLCKNDSSYKEKDIEDTMSQHKIDTDLIGIELITEHDKIATVKLIDFHIDTIVDKSTEVTVEYKDHIKRLLHDFVKIKYIYIDESDEDDIDYLKIMTIAGLWLVDKFIRDDHYFYVSELSDIIDTTIVSIDEMILEAEREIFETCGCILNYVPRTEKNTDDETERSFWEI